MVYWIISALRRSFSPAAAGMVAAFVATSVECLKLLHSPGLNAFRLTLPGVLLLGRVFSFWDVGAYWLVIFLGTLIDQQIRSGQRRSKSKNILSVPSRFRVIGAGTVASTAIAICLAQHHVHVVLSKPYTYGSLFRHKCGLLMICSTLWTMLESKQICGSKQVASQRTQ
jgi:hypothetical protein